jgi:hypothetical protein
MITIEVKGVRATVNAGRWRSTDPQLKRLLEHIIELDEADYYPDRDEALAKAAVEQLGARVVGMTPRTRYVPDRVYGPGAAKQEQETPR